MENAELLVIILGAVLPLYPALWYIYQKIGQYDVICAEFMLIRDEYRRLRVSMSRENTSQDGQVRDNPPRENPLCECRLREDQHGT